MKQRTDRQLYIEVLEAIATGNTQHLAKIPTSYKAGCIKAGWLEGVIMPNQIGVATGCAITAVTAAGRLKLLQFKEEERSPLKKYFGLAALSGIASGIVTALLTSLLKFWLKLP